MNRPIQNPENLPPKELIPLMDEWLSEGEREARAEKIEREMYGLSWEEKAKYGR